MSLESLESALEEDQVDLAVGFVDVRSGEIDAVPLFAERLMLVAGRAHPLAGRRIPVSPDELAQIPLALLPRSFVSRFYVDSYFKTHGHEPRVVLQANSMSVLLKIVAREKVATLLPGTIEFEHRDLQYVPLDPPFPVRTVALLKRRGAYRTVAAAAFETLLDDMLRNGSLTSLLTLTQLEEASPDFTSGSEM